MSADDIFGDETLPKPKSKRKSKGAATRVLDEPIDETFDAMLESANKPVSRTTSSKQKSFRKSMADAGGGWSNEIGDDVDDDENRENVNIPPIIRQGNRRAAEEIVATDIPTIPTDDIDDAIDITPEVAVAPEFSVHQIASFKEIEKEYSRERASQYIDPKIDIGILYQNLHLQEDTDAEDGKSWDWDKVFVEIRNEITNPTID